MISVEANQRNLNIGAGALAAIVGGSIGAIAPAVAIAALGMGRWNHFWTEGDYQWWFYWYAVMAGGPAVGVAAVLACAGWVAYACKRRVAASLLAVALGSIVLWILLLVTLPVERGGSKQHPTMRPVHAAVLMAGPIVTAAIITAVHFARSGRLPRR